MLFPAVPSRPLLLFTVLLAIFGTSCASLRKKRDANVEESTADLAIGTIEMVNPEQKFVLITAHRGYPMVAGTLLYTFSPSGLKAGLKVTPERKHTFISADILEGYPQKGSPVFATRAAVAASMAAAKAAGTEPPPMDNQLNWGGMNNTQVPGDGNANSSLPPLQNPFIEPEPDASGSADSNSPPTAP